MKSKEQVLREWFEGCNQNFIGFSRSELKDNLPGVIRNLALGAMSEYSKETSIAFFTFVTDLPKEKKQVFEHGDLRDLSQEELWELFLMHKWKN